MFANGDRQCLCKRNHKPGGVQIMPGLQILDPGVQAFLGGERVMISSEMCHQMAMTPFSANHEITST